MTPNPLESSLRKTIDYLCSPVCLPRNPGTDGGAVYLGGAGTVKDCTILNSTAGVATLPDLRVVLGDVHGELDELPV